MGRYSTEVLRQGILFLSQNPRGFLRKAWRFFRPMRRDYRRRLQMSLAQWLLYHQRNIVLQECHWMGVRALKNPLDAWIYQEILHDVKPDVVVEIGSFEGGGTLYLAHLLDLLGNGVVVSVDIDRTNYNVEHSRIIAITGDSSSPETVGKVSELCGGKSVLVIHDGDHRKEQVLKDLEMYSKLVSVDSYLIVEDGIIDLYRPGDSIGSMEDGPLAAVEEFLDTNPNFTVDTERERYILTYNPMGFLKRVR